MMQEEDLKGQGAWPVLMGVTAAGMACAAWVVLKRRGDYAPSAVLDLLLGAECLRRVLFQAHAVRQRRLISVPHSLALISCCLVVATMTVRGAFHYNGGNDSWNLMRVLLPALAAVAGGGVYLATGLLGWLLARTSSWMSESGKTQVVRRIRSLLYGVVPLLFFVPLVWSYVQSWWYETAHLPDHSPLSFRLMFTFGHGGVKQGLATNPAIPLDVIQSMAWDPSPETLQEQAITLGACANRALSTEELQRLFAARPSRPCLRGLSANRNTPAELLAKLADEPGTEEPLAHNPRTPPEVLLRLLGSDDLVLRLTLLSHPNLPHRQVLEKLEAESAPVGLFVRLAVDSRTPVDLLERLASHASPQVRENVAINSRTPRELLERLAQDPEQSVREQVARQLEQRR